MADETFDDVVRLILDNTRFVQGMRESQAEHQRSLEGMQRMQQKMSDEMKRWVEDTRRAIDSQTGAMKKSFDDAFDHIGNKARTAGLTIGRALRIGASGFASLGEFQGASAMYGLERIAQVADIAGIKMETLGVSAAGLGAAFAAAAVPIATMLNGMQFNKALAEMGTLLDNDAGEAKYYKADLDAIAESTVRVANRFNQDLIPTVKAFKEALSSGIEKGQLDEFMNAAGTLATASQTDLTSVVQMMAKLKDAYGLDIGQMAASTDVLFSVVDQSQAHMEEYAKSIGRLIPAAAAAGVSIVDMNAGFATLNRQGLTTSNAVTALAQFIQRLSVPAGEAKEALAKMGFAVDGTLFKTKSLGEVILELHQKIGGDNSLMAKIFPEERARRAAQSLIESQHAVELYGEIHEKINSRVGIAAAAAAKAQDSAAVQISKAWNAAGNELQLVANDMLNAYTKVFFGKEGMSEENLTHIAIAVEQVGIGIEVLGGILGAVGVAVKGAFGELKSVVTFVVEAVGAVVSLFMGDFSGAASHVGGALSAIKDAFVNVGEAALDQLNNFEKTKEAMEKSGMRVLALKEHLAELHDEAKKTKTATGDLNSQLKGNDAAMAAAAERTRNLAEDNNNLAAAMGTAGESADKAEKQVDKYLKAAQQAVEAANKAAEQLHNKEVNSAETQDEKDRVNILREQLIPLEQELAQKHLNNVRLAMMANEGASKAEIEQIVRRYEFEDGSLALQNQIASIKKSILGIDDQAIERMHALGQTGQQYEKTLKDQRQSALAVLESMGDITKLSASQIEEVVRRSQELNRLKSEMKNVETAIANVLMDQSKTEEQRAKEVKALTAEYKKLQDQAKAAALDVGGAIDKITGKFAKSMDELHKSEMASIETMQRAADARVESIQKELSSELEVLSTRIKRGNLTRDEYNATKLAIDDIARKEAGMFAEEDRAVNAQIAKARQLENQRIQAIKHEYDEEMKRLKNSDAFLVSSAEKQKELIDQLTHKRDEQIQKEIDGYGEALRAFKDAEQKKRDEVQQTIDSTKEKLKEAAKEDKKEKTGGGVSGVGYVVGGTFGGPLSGLGFESTNNSVPATRSPSSAAGGASVTNNTTNQSTINVPINVQAGATLSNSDIDAVVRQVQEQLQRNSRNQTSSSLYPSGSR